MQFVNIGFGNMVSVSRIVAVVSPDSAPIKRIISDARDNVTLIDASCGRKTRTVIIADTGHIILSGLSHEIIMKRIETGGEQENE